MSLSIEERVAELTGRLNVLERLVTHSLMDQLLDTKLMAINAERTAVRAAEVVQGALSDMASPGYTEEEADEGVMDIRGGIKKKGSNEPS